MFKKLLPLALLVNLSLTTQVAVACGAHNFYLNPDEYGLIGGTVIKLVGLAPPEPVFKVKHVPMTKVMLGVESEITVEYERPWFSSNVRMQLSSSSGVSLMDDVVELDDFDGTVKVNFSLEKPGYNTIRVKVVGVHKGEEVAHSSVIYIQAKKSVAKAGG